MTDLESKKVEDFGPDDYEDFWIEYVEEVRYFECVLCGDKIDYNIDTVIGHMERKHYKKYEQHDKRVKQND